MYVHKCEPNYFKGDEIVDWCKRGPRNILSTTKVPVLPELREEPEAGQLHGRPRRRDILQGHDVIHRVFRKKNVPANFQCFSFFLDEQ